MLFPFWIWATASLALAAWLAYRWYPWPEPDLLKEFHDYLTTHAPELRVRRTDSALEVERGDLKVTSVFSLKELQRLVLGFESRSGRRNRYAAMLKDVRLGLDEAEHGLTVEQFGPMILPRLVGDTHLAAVDPEYPTTFMPDLNLHVAYVIDRPCSMRFLKQGQLAELELSLAELHQLAMANLRNRVGRLTPLEEARESWARNEVALSSIIGDGLLSATMILLLPEQLQAGELLVADIPDRDTLLFYFTEDAESVGRNTCTEPEGEDYLLLPHHHVLMTTEGFRLISGKTPAGTS